MHAGQDLPYNMRLDTMPGDNKNTFRQFILISLLLLSGTNLYAQPLVIHGRITDNQTGKPLAYVNIRISGTQDGTFTGPDGMFTLKVKRLPASLNVTCVGYEPLYYDIDRVSQNQISLSLSPKAYALKEIDIKAVNFSFVYKDLKYSILDYEIMDDKLLLLVFRTNLKNAELILLETNGDTLTISNVPEQKPKCLFKDFLGQVHYISSMGNSFQCFYDEHLKKLEFPFHTTYEKLVKTVKPFLFSLGGRLYFQELSPDGLGTNFGYYDTAHNKQYIHSVQDDQARQNLSDDMKFYNLWNNTMQNNQQALSASGFNPKNSNLADVSNQSKMPTVDADEIMANKLFNYSTINAPMVKLGENDMAIFNFPKDVIELMNKEGKIYRKIPIDFHRADEDNILAGLLGVFIPISDWRWCGKIYIDDYFRKAYTTFSKKGIFRIREINLESGTLVSTFEIPLPFPEKIQILKGNAYFLVKDIGGDFEKWKLVRLKL